MRLDALFEIHRGIQIDRAERLLPRPSKTSVVYVRPASTQQRTIAGWVERSDIPAELVFPVGTLFVSADGEGSHTYSYVSQFEFVPSQHVHALIPRAPMSLQAKLFYAHCITMNRYRFSYGRAPRGERFRSLQLPSALSSWVETSLLENRSASSKPSSIPSKAFDINPKAWAFFRLDEIFDLKKGSRLVKADMTIGDTPFIGAVEGKNGVTARIGQPADHSAGTISVSYNGSVGEAFYQPVPFRASDDVNVLYPKNGHSLTPFQALFIVTLIRNEKFRFSYGRKWHMDRMNEHRIRLPALEDGTPDWDFMEKFVKSLPCSSQIPGFSAPPASDSKAAPS